MAFHDEVLHSLCRLCCGRPSQGTVLVSKGTIATYVKKSLGIDFSKDERHIHPDAVCNACRMKIMRWKQLTVKKKKDVPNPNIVVFPFVPHTADCSVCKRYYWDPDTVAKFARTKGLSSWIVKQGEVVAVLNHNMGRTVHKSVHIKENRCRIFALGRPVDLDFPTPQEAIEYLTKCVTCPGNDDFEDLVKTLEEPVIKGNSGQIVARVEELYREDSLETHPVIRHINCHLLVPTGDRSNVGTNRCVVCSMYRPNLFVKQTSLLKSAQTVQHTKNVLLTRQQLLSKVEKYSQEKKNLQQNLYHLKKTVKKMLDKEGVNLEGAETMQLEKIVHDYNSEMLSTMPGNSHTRLLWEQQMKALSCKSSKGMRWHPAMIKLAIAVHTKSSSAYEVLRKTGFLVLPSPRTLFNYTHFTSPASGINPSYLMKFYEEWDIENLASHQKQVSLIFDEMKIRSDLVFSKGSGKLIGFLSLGSLTEEMQKFENSCTVDNAEDIPLASHVILFMVRGLTTSMRFPAAYYFTNNATGYQIYEMADKCIHALKLIGLSVLCLVSDGASSNRKFYEIMSGRSNSFYPNYKTVNTYDRRQPLYFMCDAPHLIKTMRNNFENSNWNNKTRNLMFEKKPIKWTHVLQMYEKDVGKDRQTPGLRLAPKIKYEHLHLTPGLRMKVNLAAQVMSKTVANALQMMNIPEMTSTIHFIRMANKFFDCLNVRSKFEWQKSRNEDVRPYSSMDDERLKWLEDEFLQFLRKWRDETEEQAHLKSSERNKLCLSQATLQGCYIAVKSFIEVTKHLLSMDGVNFFLSDKLNQDPLEEFFSKQRGAGGHSDNPSAEQFGHHLLKNVAAGSSALGSSRSNVRRSSEEMSDFPLPKRKR